MLFECNCKHSAKINSDKIVLIKFFHFLNAIHASLKDLFVKSNN